MNFIDRPWPPSGKEIAGAFYIEPVEYFTAKGYHWSVTIIWGRSFYALPYRDSLFKYSGWGNPKLKQEKGDLVRFDDGTPCDCEECVSGRKEVDAGWTPWGQHFGFPK